jgi:hypothetical protein
LTLLLLPGRRSWLCGRFGWECRLPSLLKRISIRNRNLILQAFFDLRNPKKVQTSHFRFDSFCIYLVSLQFSLIRLLFTQTEGNASAVRNPLISFPIKYIKSCLFSIYIVRNLSTEHKHHHHQHHHKKSTHTLIIIINFPQDVFALGESNGLTHTLINQTYK